ncbi:LacI family DNA-binding transcriptional regulator [Psychroserpens ponticola]|uniref:LacI family DNA-binding transcriptional regulator n=1 Tax=Psychroserpens ponticola TaxID=2932268 RepID=A0ABY7RVL9_9FLAO|nr:LacI family DNA-binding transcriptional regulator [Psychroserpens ponticola]WCO00883.1 LacI family DNA-binding transcriptional regulator [Psychroserpens ponticola]
MNHLESTITLKEISQVSGYSVSTVSKALNNKPDISIDTRKVIQTIADEYNYVPNNYAVALRKKKTKTISVIVPQINTSFYSCLLFNIEKLAYTFGYRIFIFQSFEETSKEKEFMRNSNDGSVDGLIIITKNKLLNKYFKEENNLPVEHICVDENLSEERLKKECISSFNTLLRRIN